MGETTNFYQPGQEPTTPPKNYLVKSIVTLILCCWPFSIPALVNSCKVNNLWAEGKKEEAYEASHKANKWGNISIIVGVIFWVIYIIYWLVLGTAVVASGLYY